MIRRNRRYLSRDFYSYNPENHGDNSLGEDYGRALRTLRRANTTPGSFTPLDFRPHMNVAKCMKVLDSQLAISESNLTTSNSSANTSTSDVQSSLDDELIPYTIFDSSLSLPMRKRVSQYLHSLVTQVNPRYSAVMFGSSATGMYNKHDADIDIAIVADTRRYSPISDSTKYSVFSSVTALLRKSSCVRMNESIPKIYLNKFSVNLRELYRMFDYPINEISELPSFIDVDLIICNDFPDAKTNLLNDYMKCSPHLLPLCLLVKEWGKKRQMINAAKFLFNSYSLVLMCINYLQHRGLLPVLNINISQTVTEPRLKCKNQYPRSIPTPVDPLNRFPFHTINRFNLLREITNYTYVYDSDKCQTELVVKRGYVEEAIANFKYADKYLFTRVTQEAFYQDKNSEEKLGDLVRDFFNFYGYVFDHRFHAVNVRLGHCTFLQEQVLCSKRRSTVYIEDPFRPEDNAARSMDYFNSAAIEFQRAADLLNQGSSWSTCVKPYSDSMKDLIDICISKKGISQELNKLLLDI